MRLSEAPSASSSNRTVTRPHDHAVSGCEYPCDIVAGTPEPIPGVWTPEHRRYAEWYRRGYLDGATARADYLDRPNGWHAYHICDGSVRELTFAGGEALCAYCGEWCALVVRRPALSTDAEAAKPESGGTE